ncbi:hypothetical protein RHMOL_Rhmol09G0107200 [Rhododendron molle]|uniref:Uncharacterized protein n=1 Tax=Rhododendron molle TaxID=49168 RepID=A0ACC0MDV3_RHOML|nr:hypothetical protein RHMOL_Rhmol09G0107200 [Rhododendron molle]
MVDHGGNGGGGDVIDRPEGRGGPMEIETEDQQPAGAVEGTGTMVVKGSDDSRDQRQETSSGVVQRMLKGYPRETEEPRAVGASVKPLCLSTVAEGSPIVGGSFGDVSDSGAEGGELG